MHTPWFIAPSISLANCNELDLFRFRIKLVFLTHSSYKEAPVSLTNPAAFSIASSFRFSRFSVEHFSSHLR